MQKNELNLNDKFLIGFSGGSDSVYLLHHINKIKDEYNLKFALCYVNHCLRGKESDKEEEFVINLAKEQNLGLYKTRLNLSNIKGNLEEGARNERYKFFLESCKKFGVSKILLAHHKDDNVETVLLNLLRGTGLKGIKGIAPKIIIKLKGGNLEVIRPLLCLEKKGIYDFLIKNKINFIEDNSNKSSDFKRNKIRNELLPLLEKDYQKCVKDHILSFSKIGVEYYDYVFEIVNNVYKKNVFVENDTKVLNIGLFLSLPSLIQKELIRKIYEELAGDLSGLGQNHIEEIYKIIYSGSAEVFCQLLNKIIVKKQYDKLILGKLNSKIEKKILKNIKIKTNLLKKEDFNSKELIISDNNKIYCDFDKIKGELVVRHRKAGDKFIPFGMNKEKKLKDFFIDEKVLKSERDLVPILVDSEKIIWVCGFRMDERIRCDNKTKNILSVTFNPA